MLTLMPRLSSIWISFHKAKSHEAGVPLEENMLKLFGSRSLQYRHEDKSIVTSMRMTDLVIARKSCLSKPDAVNRLCAW